MANIEIYTKDFCPFCAHAKSLLDAMNLDYNEYELTFDAEKEAEMIARSQAFTVPQIFVDGQLVGGCDELYTRVEDGSFDTLLNPLPVENNTKLEIANHV
jgi:glutaredoxin 3